MADLIRDIPVHSFTTRVFDIWDKTWLLLTCGDLERGEYNTMTVAWGGFGNMWNFPLALVVVRPTRYTYQFINQYESFSLCAFPEEFRKALNLLGTKSGSNSDKIVESGLSPAPSQRISSPGYKEADLWIECEKMYWQDFDPSHFLIDKIGSYYAQKDFHRMIFGRIISVKGDPEKYAF